MSPLPYNRDIEAAGFIVRLKFDDLALSKQIKIPFPSPAKLKIPSSVISVYSERKPLPKRCFNRPDITITGEGEYDAAFDMRSRKGYITINADDDAVILTNFLTRVFSQLVIANNGLMFHSACVIKNNRAYIFHGESGAGKSTVCRFSKGCRIASDDLTAVRKIGRSFKAWGIPQLGRFPIPDKLGPYPIKALISLIKDRKTTIMPMNSASTVAAALALHKNQLVPGQISKMLELMDKLTDDVPGYELHFQKNPSFWKCIKET